MQTFQFTDEEVKEIREFLYYANRSWDSDAVARAALTREFKPDGD